MEGKEACNYIANRIKDILSDKKINVWVSYKEDTGICRIDFQDIKEVELARQRGGFASETNSFIEYDVNKDLVINYDLNRVLPDNVNIFYIYVTEPSAVGVNYKHKAIELVKLENISEGIPIEKMLDIIDDFYHSEKYTRIRLESV